MKLIVDLDGTICPIKKENQKYEDLVPFPEIVKKLQELKLKGTEICIFTSRQMRTFDGNIGKINKYTLPKIIDWLNKWNIPYDEIVVGKPWPTQEGFYVDDRAVRPKELLKYTYSELNALCNQDKL